MKIKLILSTENKDIEHWTELPYVPRINEWINLQDMLKTNELEIIRNAAICWSGSKSIVQSIEYRHNGSEFYPEIYVWCED